MLSVINEVIRLNYLLGLDIGIASVGWAVINEDKKRIEDLGVRVFNAAENAKDGSSLALPRRMARGRRRLTRRKAYRIQRVKNLMIKCNVISEEEYSKLFDTRKFQKDVWQLRYEGLNRKLNQEEWVRILINLCKRRGFKSNRKNEAKDNELGVIIQSIRNNQKIMQDKQYRTVGEMIYLETITSNDPYRAKRNKDKKYNKCVSRKMIEDEIKILFEKQSEYRNVYASKTFEEEYLKVFNSQRPFSKFEDLEKMIGLCTFEKSNKEKRAPKASYSAQEFILYTNINNLRIINKGDKRKLTSDEITKIEELAFSKKEIKYTTLRKELNLKDDDRFSLLNYSSKTDMKKTESCKFVSLNGYYELKKAVESGINKRRWDEIKNDIDLLNDIAYVLTLGKTDDDIRKQMKIRNIPEDIINAVSDLSFSGFVNLSIKALKKINPYLKNGFIYNEACEKAGYNFKAIYEGDKERKLPIIEIDEIVNPVVNRALSQSRKVINAVIEKYGSPVGINIELARDLAKNFKDRKIIEKNQKENRIEKDKIRNELKELMGKEPTGAEILKYRLWQQQKEECAYTQEKIYIDKLFEPGAYEIDHILPFSRSFDDSLTNKVLVKGVENQRKSNRTPYEYFGSDKERWHKFEVWVEESNLPQKKKFNLLKKKFGVEEAREFKSRNLNDTRYICSYLLNFINNRLIFKESERKRKTIAVNGRATAYLRAKWGLIKVRSNGDKHHALDAAVVAVTTQGMVNEISKYNKAKELKYVRNGDDFIDIETGEIVKLDDYKYLLKDRLPMPWREFSEELKMRLSDDPSSILERESFSSYDEDFKKTIKPIFVSRVPQRKVGGKLFKETVYSSSCFKGRSFILKKPLQELKKGDFDKIYNYDTDKKLYEALYTRFNNFNGNAKKAFEEEFRKPTKSGKLGPVVRSIKVIGKAPFLDGVNLNNGLVAKDGIARIDLYEKNKKYYVVPVYRKDIAVNIIPKKAATANKSEKDWTVIDDSYSFKFSVFKNDLINIKFEKEDKEDIFGYFDSFNRHTASIKVITHDNSKEIEGIGIKVGVKEITKYQVDVLGNYSKVRK